MAVSTQASIPTIQPTWLTVEGSLNSSLGMSTGWLVIFEQRSGQPPINQRTTSSTAAMPGGRSATMILA